MEYKKPQTTIVQGGVGIYPLTTADQVILADGSRLEKDGKISVSVADSAKLGGKAPEYYLQPRNLLDNSDFTNPVNQRGATSYPSGNGVYNIDRWLSWIETAEDTANIVIQDGHITVEPGAKLQQKLISYKQNTIYTAAAKRTDGTVLIVSGTFTNDEKGEDIYIKFGSDGRANVGLRSGDYLWAALYEGAYTAASLPPYVPKGYAAELAECQRYYRTFSVPVIPCANNPAGTQVYGYLPINMRSGATPSAIDDTLYFFYGGGSFVRVTSATASVKRSGIRIVFNLESSVVDNLDGNVGGNGLTLTNDL